MIRVTSDSAGLVLASNNGMYSAMEPSDAGADLVEKDPTGRYVRVYITVFFNSISCSF